MTGKIFRSLSTSVFTLGFIVAIPSLAAAQAAAKPASLAGTWNMSLIGDHVVPVALVLEQNGSALKGTFILMGKDFTFTGDVNGDTFSLTGRGPALRSASSTDRPAAAAPAAPAARPQPPAGSITMADTTTINGTADAEGGLAGEMVSKYDGQTGSVKWTAERLRERKVPTEVTVSSASVDMTGKWAMNIVEAQVQIAVELKQMGTKVTGTATSDHLGTMTLWGTLANGTLTFATDGETSGEIQYTGKLKTDGSFAGDLTSQLGAMTWTMAQVKK